MNAFHMSKFCQLNNNSRTPIHLNLQSNNVTVNKYPHTSTPTHECNGIMQKTVVRSLLLTFVYLKNFAFTQSITSACCQYLHTYAPPTCLLLETTYVNVAYNGRAT